MNEDRAKRFADLMMQKMYDVVEPAPDGGVFVTFTPEMMHEAMWEMGDCTICGDVNCAKHPLSLQKARFAAERENLGPPMRMHFKGAPPEQLGR